MSFIDQIIVDNDAAVTDKTDLGSVTPVDVGGRLNAITRELRPYQVYTAVVLQSGMDAPTVYELENTLGEEPVWDYTDVGRYGLNTESGNFAQFYTWASVSDGDNAISLKRQQVRWENGSRLVLVQHDGSGYVDGLTHLYVEIRVFQAPIR